MQIFEYLNISYYQYFLYYPNFGPQYKQNIFADTWIYEYFLLYFFAIVIFNIWTHTIGIVKNLGQAFFINSIFDYLMFTICMVYKMIKYLLFFWLQVKMVMAMMMMLKLEKGGLAKMTTRIVMVKVMMTLMMIVMTMMMTVMMTMMMLKIERRTVWQRG